MNTQPFVHNNRGAGRPQILLIGNGLERGKDGQPEWSALLDALRAPGRAKATEKEKETVPFPLLYQLLSTPDPPPAVMRAEAIKAEEARLAEGLKCLKHSSNALLDRLPFLGADHIFTTNYPYSLEAAFYPRRDVQNARSRGAIRFSLCLPDKDGNWHIHGETGVPTGIVVGHDRYGRLLSRMEQLCGKEISRTMEEKPREFRSWPELFLFGDVYVLGFGFALCEYDLWWLLRRKQRERYADGSVYFFYNGQMPESSVRDRLLETHGVLINPFGVNYQPDYTTFYNLAMDAITEQIHKNKT